MTPITKERAIHKPLERANSQDFLKNIPLNQPVEIAHKKNLSQDIDEF